jgi:hypothetical protein
MLMRSTVGSQVIMHICKSGWKTVYWPNNYAVVGSFLEKRKKLFRVTHRREYGQTLHCNMVCEHDRVSSLFDLLNGVIF